ncbi:hypothetical protein KQI33_06940 [Enterococcus devriesei]|uniref:hypothetical protein n=1 Tax=Enterococcus devriesei TaxID=319970 RepID=UPI001C123F31|nr:hypothetical protein [Enterococcus devriesei]MBU5365105.1 hypothetical protein [Enterococcus devriesei]
MAKQIHKLVRDLEKSLDIISVQALGKIINQRADVYQQKSDRAYQAAIAELSLQLSDNEAKLRNGWSKRIKKVFMEQQQRVS